MSRRTLRRGPAAGLIAVLAVLLAAVTIVVVPQGSVAHADAGARGGDYVPFTSPRVVLDTRSGAVKPSDSTTPFQVLGVGGIPTTGVSAVYVRVVGVTTVSASTWLTLYPDLTARPGVAMANVPAGMALSNTAIVRPGSNGRIAVFNHGAAHIVVDVQGYFTTATGSTWGGLVSVPQRRVVDTRTGLGTTKAQIPANGTRTINLATAGVPVGATAVSVGLTVPSTATGAGWFSSTPGAATTPQSGVIQFENGFNSASGAFLPLGADGRVTFTNNSPKPADLIVDILAYFTRTATAGAGLRPLTNRLLSGATVPANGVIDVVVGGTNGMPTRGIAGAALSLQAGGGAYGALRAWPTGTTEPTTAHTQHHPNGIGRASAVIKPGTDGKVRIKNISSASVTLYVDLEGWFADPVPAAPVPQNSPVSILQAVPPAGQATGTVEYAYVDNIGRVVIGHQSDLNNFGSTQYTVISGNEAFAGRPALTHRPDFTVQVAAQYSDSDIWVNSQTGPGAATWRAWSDVGGSMAASPASATLTTGTSVLFAVDVDGNLWAYAQTGAVPFWRNLGDQNLTGAPAVVSVRDGVQVFGTTDTGAVVTILYRTDGSLSTWTSLGGSGLTGTPAVVVYPGFRLRVFAHAADATVVTKLQDTTGAFPAAWDAVGTLVAAGPPAAMLDPARGRTAVVARGADNIIYYSYETTQGSGVFGSWTAANNETNLAATDPTVAQLSSGGSQFLIFAYRDINSMVWIYDGRQVGGATLHGTALPAP